MKNETMLRRVGIELSILNQLKRRRANIIGHMLGHDRLNYMEGKMEATIIYYSANVGYIMWHLPGTKKAGKQQRRMESCC